MNIKIEKMRNLEWGIESWELGIKNNFPFPISSFTIPNFSKAGLPLS